MRTEKTGSAIFRASATILAAIFAAQQLTADKAWLMLLDNVHWTTGNAAAAAMAWVGYANSSGTERAARRWFLIGLAAYLIGQIFWDIQVYIGWNPFPAPSDVFYLMLGPGCLLGLVAAMFKLLPAGNRRITLLDATMMSIALIALTLTVYLPRSSEIDLLTLTVMTAYPVVLLSAACFGVLMVLHVRPAVAWPWIVFQIGLGLQGLVWMWWNVQAMSGTTVDGSLLNELFSVASLVIGYAAMHWRMAPANNPAYAKWCDGFLRMLPILAVVMASLSAMLVLSNPGMLAQLRDMILLVALSVVLLAALRQSLMLEDRERLLEAEQAVAASSRFLQLVMDTVPSGIFWKDRELRYLGGNAAVARAAGLGSSAELAGKSDDDLIWKEFADVYRADDRAVMDSGASKLNFDERVHFADGSSAWVRTSKVPLRNGEGKVVGILGVYNDVTLTKQYEELQRIAAVTFETQEAIMITDPEARILRANRAFEEITGYSAEEVAGQNPRLLQSGRHDAAFYREMWATLLDTGRWSGEVWDKRKNGDIYPKSMTITAVYDDRHRVTHYVAVFRDITNRKVSEQAIHQLAFYDTLTGLPNRRLLMDRLQHALASSQRSGHCGALLFLDLDHFKKINDTQGHATGDKLLIEVSKRLLTCVREGDSIARLGGDEFVVVLEDLSNAPQEAAAQTGLIAEKIRHVIGEPYALDGFDCTVTPSIGISMFHGHRESVDDLLKHADVAMYQAKLRGRNIICYFDPGMQTELDARAGLEADLRLAVEQRQFHLNYQIQVDNRNRALGAEVLLRWNHPARGMIPPGIFIPLAEDIGLINTIGAWVFAAACAQIRAWQQDALMRDLPLSVNVSARQFRDPDFVPMVRRILRESGIRPSLLKLELTESTVLENVEDTIAKMHALKEIGTGFSMDDFGTGYSSLQYLKRLPLDQIKIDQSFVRDIGIDPNDAAIVQTIIAMTQALGLQVIAEGVETELQREFLDSRGCHNYQGYLIGKPVPLDQFETLMHRDFNHPAV
ncbi:MAG: EAL domain-containing protein [Nitrosomonadales bacterium]|nr:EAL domain-containing protein [Nitrosomonadales bacterium]